MKVTFRCDPDKCMSCGACAVACMDQNDVDIAAGESPLRHVVTYEEDGKRVFMSLACMHCDDAPCVKGCPTGCLYKDTDTGLTLYDPDKCIGCHSCSMACPYGAPTFVTFVKAGKRDKMKKCDGCIERLRNGLEPACVHACPIGALTCEIGDGVPSAEFCKAWPRVRVED